jgi:hypothetical protein
MPVWPYCAATCVGVYPRLSRISRRAPLRRRHSAVGREPRTHAQCIAVCDSPSVAFTAAPFSMRNAAAATRLFSAAHCSGTNLRRERDGGRGASDREEGEDGVFQID